MYTGVLKEKKEPKKRKRYIYIYDIAKRIPN